MTTRAATKQQASTRNTQHNAFRAGDHVEYDGKLAKVVNFGFLELPTAPGQDAAFSDSLVAHLQLPAQIPGGEPEYAFFVPASEITSLRGNTERLNKLQREFNPLFGERPPADLSATANDKGPAIRKPGTVTPAPAAPAAAPRGTRAPIDMARTAAVDGKVVNTAQTYPVSNATTPSANAATDAKTGRTSSTRGSKRGGAKKARSSKKAGK